MTKSRGFNKVFNLRALGHDIQTDILQDLNGLWFAGKIQLFTMQSLSYLHMKVYQLLDLSFQVEQKNVGLLAMFFFSGSHNITGRFALNFGYFIKVSFHAEHFFPFYFLLFKFFGNQ